MLDNRCNCCNMSCRSKVTAWVIGITLFLAALLIGAVVGSFVATFVAENIVALAIFGIVLLLAAIFTALFARCRCED